MTALIQMPKTECIGIGATLAVSGTEHARMVAQRWANVARETRDPEFARDCRAIAKALFDWAHAQSFRTE